MSAAALDVRRTVSNAQSERTSRTEFDIHISSPLTDRTREAKEKDLFFFSPPTTTSAYHFLSSEPTRSGTGSPLSSGSSSAVDDRYQHVPVQAATCSFGNESSVIRAEFRGGAEQAV